MQAIAHQVGAHKLQVAGSGVLYKLKEVHKNSKLVGFFTC